jgi:uncharacterized protein (TIGR03083 family)
MSDPRSVRPDVVFVLAAECARISTVTAALSEDDFRLPTRCPPWDVKALLGHLWRDVDRIGAALDEPEPAAATADAVGYFRSYDPAREAEGIAARGLEVADARETGAAMARAFDERWRACTLAARRADLGRLLQTRLVAIRLDAFCATRVLEVAVHGLDLARALGRTPWLTDAAEEVTSDILTALLEDAPPAAWDPVTFIEAGTGRRALTDQDRLTLGPAAARFPLLG